MAEVQDLSDAQILRKMMRKAVEEHQEAEIPNDRRGTSIFSASAIQATKECFRHFGRSYRPKPQMG